MPPHLMNEVDTVRYCKCLIVFYQLVACGALVSWTKLDLSFSTGKSRPFGQFRPKTKTGKRTQVPTPRRLSKQTLEMSGSTGIV